MVIKSGGIVFFYLKPISELRSGTCHMAPVNCATPATLRSRHLSGKDLLIYRPIDLKTISIFRPIFSDILLAYCIH